MDEREDPIMRTYLDLKRLSVLFTVVAIMLAFATSGNARELKYKFIDIAPGVHVLSFIFDAPFGGPRPSTSNIPIIITDEGVLIMDTLNPFFASIAKKEIAKRTDQPVKYVVYSHANADHLRGAGIFKDTAQYIAQKRQVRRLKLIKEDSFPMPDILFDKEMTLNLGGKEIVLRDYGENHATGVVVMHLPKEKVITAIDIVYVKRLAFYFMPDFNPTAWRDSLREIQKLDFETVITGHTELANRAEFIEFADYIDDLMTQTRAVWKKVNHMGPFAAVEIAKKQVDLSKYKDWAMYKQFRDLNIMAAYLSIDMGF